MNGNYVRDTHADRDAMEAYLAGFDARRAAERRDPVTEDAGFHEINVPIYVCTHDGCTHEVDAPDTECHRHLREITLADAQWIGPVRNPSQVFPGMMGKNMLERARRRREVMRATGLTAQEVERYVSARIREFNRGR